MKKYGRSIDSESTEPFIPAAEQAECQRDELGGIMLLLDGGQKWQRTIAWERRSSHNYQMNEFYSVNQKHGKYENWWKSKSARFLEHYQVALLPSEHTNITIKCHCALLLGKKSANGPRHIVAFWRQCQWYQIRLFAEILVMRGQSLHVTRYMMIVESMLIFKTADGASWIWLQDMITNLWVTKQNVD